VKKAVRWHDQLANKFSLASGTHRITVIATDNYTQASSEHVRKRHGAVNTRVGPSSGTSENCNPWG